MRRAHRPAALLFGGIGEEKGLFFFARRHAICYDYSKE